MSPLQGDYAVALGRHAECDGLSARLGDERAVGFVRSLRGSARLFSGDLTEAVAEFEESLAIFERIGETEGMLWVLFQLAISLSHQGDSASAQDICRRSIRISESLGERLCRSYALWFLAHAGGCLDRDARRGGRHRTLSAGSRKRRSVAHRRNRYPRG